MKSKWTTKILFLMMILAFNSMVGRAQSNDKIEQAKVVAKELTDTMTLRLDLTEMQQKAIAPFNLAYVNSLFLSELLTDEAIAEIDNTLDANLKKALSEEQYELWTDNKVLWTDIVKSKVPKEMPSGDVYLEEADKIFEE